jgi:nucleoside phosphorylase
MPDILTIAATRRELCGHEGLVCGVGPVEAAAATARALAVERPAAVLHVGIAGAVGIEPGSLVVGAEAVYVDLRAAIPLISECSPDPMLTAAARTALPGAQFLPISTSASVGGSRSLHPDSPTVEAMEGFGVLRACELAGVPAVEVRAIANAIGEEDRRLWRVDEAIAELSRALPRVSEAVAAAVS